MRHILYYSMIVRPKLYAKTNKTNSIWFDKDVHFMRSLICFVGKCKYIGFSISRDILNRDIILSTINILN